MPHYLCYCDPSNHLVDDLLSAWSTGPVAVPGHLMQTVVEPAARTSRNDTQPAGVHTASDFYPVAADKSRLTLLSLPTEIRLLILGCVADDIRPSITCRYLKTSLGDTAIFRTTFPYRGPPSSETSDTKLDNECQLPRVCRQLRYEFFQVLGTRALDVTRPYDLDVLSLAGIHGMSDVLASRLCWDYLNQIKQVKLSFRCLGPPPRYETSRKTFRDGMFKTIKYGLFPALQTVHVVMDLPCFPITAPQAALILLPPAGPLIECFTEAKALQHQVESADFRKRLEAYCVGKLGKHVDRPGRTYLLDLEIRVAHFSARHRKYTQIPHPAVIIRATEPQPGTVHTTTTVTSAFIAMDEYRRKRGLSLDRMKFQREVVEL